MVIDRRQAHRTQVFTPANSTRFSAKRAARPVPHALRCRFRDEDHDYAQAEVRVYRPGYTSATATQVEERRLPGQTVRNTVSGLLAYMLRSELARREDYTIEVDWEHLVTQQGGRVGLLHDALHDRAWSGRATAVVAGVAPNSVDVTLDVDFDLRDAIQYWGIVRPAVGRPGTYTAERTASADTIRLGGAGGSPAVSVGDLVAAGQVGTGIEDCVLVGIVDAGEARARLSLISYGGSAVFEAQPGYTVEYTNPGGMVSEVAFGAREQARLANPLTTTQTIYKARTAQPARPAGEAIPADWTTQILDDRVVWTVMRMVTVYPLVADPAPATYDLAGLTLPVGSEVEYGPWSEVALAPWVGMKEVRLALVDKLAQRLILAVRPPVKTPDEVEFRIRADGGAMLQQTIAADASGAVVNFESLCPGARYRCQARALYDLDDAGPWDYLLVGLPSETLSVFPFSTTALRAATVAVAGQDVEYVWQYDLGAGSIRVWLDGGTTTHTNQIFSGLAPNTQYNVRVRVDIDGVEGDWSPEAVGFTLQQEAPPDPVPNINLVISAAGESTVTYGIPDSAHPLDRFGIRMLRDGALLHNLSTSVGPRRHGLHIPRRPRRGRQLSR